MSHYIRHEWNCSLPSVSNCWRSFSSTISHLLCLLQLVTLPACSLMSAPLCQLLYSAAAAAKSLQSCLTLCDPIDGSPPGSAIPGILQARTLEWVAIAFSIVWKWKVKVKSLSHVRLIVTPWTAAYQAPPSMGFSRQQYWSGLPLPSPLYSSTILLEFPWWLRR